MLSLALNAARQAKKSVGVIDAHSVKPLDTACLDGLIGTPLLTLEENALIGGFYSAVASYYAARGRRCPSGGWESETRSCRTRASPNSWKKTD